MNIKPSHRYPLRGRSPKSIEKKRREEPKSEERKKGEEEEEEEEEEGGKEKIESTFGDRNAK